MKANNYLDKNKDSYDEMASLYRLRREEGDFSIYPDIIIFSDLLEKSFRTPSVLDVGPGAGIISNYFFNRGFKTTAIDISDEMIKVAKENSPETKYLIGNFLGYDFENEKFNGLFAKAIVHLFSKEDASLFIKKSYELLGNNGLFYFSLFIRNKSDEGFKKKNMRGRNFIRYTKDWTKNELECLLEDFNFNMLHTFNLTHGTMIKWSGIFKKD
jgi:SAM-dependent methyltransferase